MIGAAAAELEIGQGDRVLDLGAGMIGEAFHWFDRPRALAEIRRVLRLGGGLSVLSSAPDWTGASWADELGALVVGSRPEHPALMAGRGVEIGLSKRLEQGLRCRRF